MSKPCNRSLISRFSKYLLPALLGVLAYHNSLSQTIGGVAAYNFVKLPASPQLSALGGINVSNISPDLGLAFNMPALLRPEMDRQLLASFNSSYAGVKNFSAAFMLASEKLRTNFAAGVHYLDYGSVAQTDPSGNVAGVFRPRDYVAQVSASRKYLSKWHYGGTLKFIGSNYGLYRSAAVAMDLAVNWYDSAKLLQAGLLLSNMGVQVRRYNGSAADGLPFDAQLGITKRLVHAPLQFSFTAHHLHQFDIRYADSSIDGTGRFTADKIFRHFVFAAQVYIGDKIEVSVGYNHLRRRELVINNTASGLTGISFGAGALFRKLQIRYARTHYQNNTAYNQFGLNLSFGSTIFPL